MELASVITGFDPPEIGEITTDFSREGKVYLSLHGEYKVESVVFERDFTVDFVKAYSLKNTSSFPLGKRVRLVAYDARVKNIYAEGSGNLEEFEGLTVKSLDEKESRADVIIAVGQYQFLLNVGSIELVTDIEN